MCEKIGKDKNYSWQNTKRGMAERRFWRNRRVSWLKVRDFLVNIAIKSYQDVQRSAKANDKKTIRN